MTHCYVPHYFRRRHEPSSKKEIRSSSQCNQQATNCALKRSDTAHCFGLNSTRSTAAAADILPEK